MNTPQEFYIELERQHYGPYDLMSIIRKIRSGQIIEETVIFAAGEEEGSPAGRMPVFRDVFLEMADEAATDGTERATSLKFSFLLKNAFETFAMNLVMSLYTGMLLLGIIILGLAIYTVTGNFEITALLGSIFGCYAFMLYQMAILRKTRMQLIGFGFFTSIIRRRGLHLLIVSAILGTIVFAIPIILSDTVGPMTLALILLPGSFILFAMVYAPFFVADRGIGAFEAMRCSCSSLSSLGRDNVITLYLVFLLNFIGAGILGVPLLLSLPLTLTALCEVYDEQLNQFKVG